MVEQAPYKRSTYVQIVAGAPIWHVKRVLLTSLRRLKRGTDRSLVASYTTFT